MPLPRIMAGAQDAQNRYRSALLYEVRRRPALTTAPRHAPTALERLQRRVSVARERLADAWDVLRGRATACRGDC